MSRRSELCSRKKSVLSAISELGTQQRIYNSTTSIDTRINFDIGISEIGNLNDCPNDIYIFELKYLNKPVHTSDKNEPFHLCACGAANTVNYSWNIIFFQISEEDLIDISANPIVIEMKHAAIIASEEEEEESIKFGNNTEFQTYGYFLICCDDLMEPGVDSIKDITTILMANTKYGMEMKTWPNLPFIKYTVKLSQPLVAKGAPKLRKLGITFESIVNLTDQMLEKDQIVEIGMNLILRDHMFQKISIVNGKLRNRNKQSLYKKRYNLDKLMGDEVKMTDIPANQTYDLNDFELSSCNEYNLQENLKNEHVLSFQCQFQCFLLEETVDNLINSQFQTIEILLNVSGNLNHYIGVLDFGKFKEVDVKKSRFLIPLRYYPKEIINEFINNLQYFTDVPSAMPRLSRSKRTSSRIIKSNRSEKSFGTMDNNSYVLNYVMNSNFQSTCLILEVEFDEPYNPRVTDEYIFSDEDTVAHLKHGQVFYLAEYNLKLALRNYTTKFEQTSVKCCDQLLDLELLEQIKYERFENCALVEAHLMSKVLDYVYLNFNFDGSIDVNDLLEESYVFVVNKLYDLERPRNEYNSIDFRIKCALECYELGFLDEAQDFYLMNIDDDIENKAKRYIDFAIHNLYIKDIPMAWICLKEALKCDPNYHFSYLFQAYLYFNDGEFLKCENILLKLINDNRNFIEAYTALLVFYLSEDRNLEVIELKQKISDIYLINKYNQCNLAHHQTQDFLWQCKRKDDPILNSIMHFIKWGFFKFAEIALNFIIHIYNADSYEYLFYMSLINYYRKDYTNALQCLSAIKATDTDSVCNKKIIAVHCLLEVNSLMAIEEFHNLLVRHREEFCKKYLYTTYMKIGRYYYSFNKFKTARYYLKQSCYHLGTYVSLRLLGIVMSKCRECIFAEMCFKTIYKMNPYNKICWPYLSNIYRKKNYYQQYELCNEKMEKYPITDENQLDEIRKITTDVDLGLSASLFPESSLSN